MGVEVFVFGEGVCSESISFFRGYRVLDAGFKRFVEKSLVIIVLLIARFYGEIFVGFEVSWVIFLIFRFLFFLVIDFVRIC